MQLPNTTNSLPHPATYKDSNSSCFCVEDIAEEHNLQSHTGKSLAGNVEAKSGDHLYLDKDIFRVSLKII